MMSDPVAGSGSEEAPASRRYLHALPQAWAVSWDCVFLARSRRLTLLGLTRDEMRAEGVDPATALRIE